MTPADLAARYPNLFHVAWPEARPHVEAHGLLSPLAACQRLGFSPERTREVLTTRRPTLTTLGEGFILNDNTPVLAKSLRLCLPDDISVEDWLVELNSRVFLFPTRKAADAFANAAAVRDRARDIYTFDTLAFAKAHHDRMEITPFNTGAAVRKPPYRDRSTFAPLTGLDFAEWRTRRGLKGRDSIREVCVRHSAPEAMAALVRVDRRQPA